MPFDPISATVAGAGLLFDFLKSQGAQKTAAENQRFQRDSLIQALSEARQGRTAAGGLRLDQFGNATYYDPNQGRWITTFSPTQQRIIDEGQARQRRAQIRGTQASEDYDRLRAEYLYRRPKTEAQAYDEIVRLINQAQGEGDRAESRLMDRFTLRTTGNIPQLISGETGPSEGQRLAETMLKARQAALEESLKRESGHTSRFLPALKQFEETANLVAPIDPTGSSIIGLESEGRKAMSEYDKLLANIAVSGARNVGGAYDTATKAAGGGPGASDFMRFAQMLMPGKEGATPTALGRGARASTSGDDSGGGSYESLANQIAHGFVRKYGERETPVTRGMGYGGLPRGGVAQDEAVALGGANPDYPGGTWGLFNQPSGALNLGSRTGAAYGSSFAGEDPYGDIGGRPATRPYGDYRLPFGAWQF